MPEIASRLKRDQAHKVLDLGCGTERHTIFLAKQGFDLYALDSSSEALAQTQRWLSAEGLSAILQLQDMTSPLPYADGTVDGVISVQVIHYGTLHTIQKIVDEITRVLKPGGLLFVTVPSLRNQGKSFEQIKENTFVPLDGREKGLPHHFFTPEELKSMFPAFTVENIHLDTSKHYCLLGTKQA